MVDVYYGAASPLRKCEGCGADLEPDAPDMTCDLCNVEICERCRKVLAVYSPYLHTLDLCPACVGKKGEP